MYKKLLPILCFTFLVFSDVITKDYTFPAPQINNNIIYMEGCRLSRTSFAPCVAEKPVQILLPCGQKAVSFSVSYSEPVCLDKEYYIAPFRPGGRISVGPPAGYYSRRSSVYDKNEFFPAAVAEEYFTTQFKNGFGIFITTIHPVQYNPVTGQVKFYNKISVSVNTVSERGPTLKYFPHVKSLLQNQVDNPEMLDNIPFTQKGPQDYEYLVLTTDNLKNSFGPFVDFNKRRGLRTQIQTIQYIRSNVSGTDDPDKLRNYIKDQYEKYNIIFVLLGGDDDNTNAEDMNHRGLRAQMYDYGTDFYDDKDIPADLYFSCLDGTWKVSGSQYYGEYGSEDIGWEVYAARFAVDNTTELTNAINKTIKYTEQPVADQVKNNLVAGEFSWGPPDHPVECYTKFELELLRDSISNKNGYTTYGFGKSWANDTLFDKDKTWTGADMINMIKNKDVIWINHGGHSNNTYTLKINASQVTNTNFDNNGTNANFWIAYLHGCYQGAWDNRSSSGSYSTTDCIVEAWTTGISNGAVAIVSNSRYGLGDDGTVSPDGSDGSSPRFQRYFHDAIFRSKIHYLEMMTAYAKESNKDLVCIPDAQITQPKYFGQMKYCCYEVDVLGDPALSIWTQKPTALQADHPAKIVSNAASFSWDTKKPYTIVALLSGDGATILCSQMTGVDGKCEITEEGLKTYLAANPNGKLKINVKAHNHLLYSGEIQIEPSSGISNNFDVSLNSHFDLSRQFCSFSYTLFEKGLVDISIYDSKGALVKTVLNNYQDAGEHSAVVNNHELGNGIYYLRMLANKNKVVRKFVVTR